jgi:DNA repair exonuclease SbcCD nuclease subunit
MTGFRFVHAADLHLGSQFRGLAVNDPEIAERFANAVRSAFSSLVLWAIDEKVDFVVLAGDIYDGDWKDNTVGLFFNREVSRLHRADIPVFLLKGNHDAASVVTRSISLPDTVRDFGIRRPATFQIEHLKVALHGQGFAERAANENLALTYPQPVAGWFNIGVLHTSLTGRPPHANYAPCSVEDLRSRGYDYWALGHAHDYEVVSQAPAIVFPGILQGRNIRESGPKGAVIVTVEDNRVASIDQLILDEARWATADVDCTGHDRLGDILLALERELAGIVAEAGERLVALRVRLAGETVLRRWLVASRSTVRDEVQAACHRLHPDIWLERLVIDVDEPSDPAVLPADPGFDLAASLERLIAEPELKARGEGIIKEIAAKLPGGLGVADLPLGDDVETILADARDLVVMRTRPED